MKLKPYWLLIVFMLWGLVSCSDSSNDHVDGDSIQDGDSEVEQTDVDNIPSACKDIDCSPGTCKAVNGYAACECPEGYEVFEKTNCRSIGGDSDSTSDGDEDSSSDGDRDHDRDSIDGDIDSDACDGDVEWERDLSRFLPCSTQTGPPCIHDYPFTWIDDRGTFRIGPSGMISNGGPDVWNNWIVFRSAISVVSSDIFLLLFDYESEKTVRLGDNHSGVYASIRDGQVYWNYVIGAPDYRQDVYCEMRKTTLDRITSTSVSTTGSYKMRSKTFRNQVYWLDDRLVPGGENYHLYTLDANGQDIRVDQYRNTGLGNYYDVYENRIVYVLPMQDPYFKIILSTRDGDSFDERVIAELPYSYRVYQVVLRKNKLYWTDRCQASDLSASHCGFSIIEYDLNTDVQRVLLDGNQADKRVNDVWEDWMVYSDWREGGGSGDTEFCAGSAKSDIYLYYIPTGEEWNLSHHEGRQDNASIWKNIVVWRDGREQPDNLFSPPEDLYGVDLCKHPELKTRFPGCM